MITSIDNCNTNDKAHCALSFTSSCFVNDAFKTDCIKNMYMFQCTDDINAVLKTAFTKDDIINYQNQLYN